MATRSFIAVKQGDLFKDIYCQNDGYLSYNGRMLLTYYNTLEKVLELLELGDISYLGEYLNHSKEAIDSKGLITFAYGRDRNEKGTHAKVHTDIKELRFDEYAYLFKDGVWYYRTWEQSEYVLLTLDMCKD